MYVFGVVSEDQVNDHELTVSHKDWGTSPACTVTYDPTEREIHRRVLINVPINVVSDDNQHDTHFVRHFMDNTVPEWLASEEVEALEPGLKTRITTIHCRSDNAAQHFKQGGSLHAMSINQPTGYVSCGYTFYWDFNAPHHGKDCIDGYGGIIKNATCAYLLANDVFIATEKEVFDIMKMLFDGEAARRRYDDDPSIVIKRWFFYWVDQKDIIRPKGKDQVVNKATSEAEKTLQAKVQRLNTAVEKLSKKLAACVKPTVATELQAQLDEKRAERVTAYEEYESACAVAATLATEKEDAEDASRITSLKAFHGLGVRNIFSFFFVHRSGMVVRVNGCNCSFCFRNHCPYGFWLPPEGCLLGEPTEYAVIERFDVNWKKDKMKRLLSLADHVWQEGCSVGDIVAIGGSDVVDSSVYKYSRNSYDPYFPSAIFGAFRLIRIVGIYEDTFFWTPFELRLDYDVEDGWCMVPKPGEFVYVENAQSIQSSPTRPFRIGASQESFFSTRDQLRVNFGQDIPMFQEQPQQQQQQQQQPLKNCIRLNPSMVKRILVACYNGRTESESNNTSSGSIASSSAST